MTVEGRCGLTHRWRDSQAALATGASRVDEKGSVGRVDVWRPI
jgi:hypothetical protein